VFGRLVWQRHDRFGSFGFDMGIYDQAVWLLSRLGGQFITVRGLPVFGHHVNLALYALVPFYWLGGGPHLLNLLQVASMSLGAVPIFLLSRHRLHHGGLALLLAAAFLLHPALQFMAWELFHPDAMAITPLLFAYWFAVRRRWGWFAACAVLAMAWKEDVALAVVVIGLVIAARGDRRLGLTTASLALVWFIFVTRVVLPHFNGSHPFYLSWFPQLGATPAQMAVNAVRHPSRVTSHLVSPDATTYLWKMAAPFGLVPLLAPGTLALGVPQVLVNLLSVNDFTRKITFHYTALPLTALALGAVEGTFVMRRRLRGSRAPVVLVAGAALAATLAWGPSPVGAEFHHGWWPPASDPRRQAKEAALRKVPTGAAVSATYEFVPHLTHRKRVYEFPNPFEPANWGVHDEHFPGPAAARWLVVDTELVTTRQERDILGRVLHDGEFDTRFDRDGVIVAERVALPPTSPTQSPG
jgi:uncharacterized membrane protein